MLLVVDINLDLFESPLPEAENDCEKSLAKNGLEKWTGIVAEAFTYLSLTIGLKKSTSLSNPRWCSIEAVDP